MFKSFIFQQATPWEDENLYKCHDISGDLLVAGYYNTGMINVWDVRAKKKVFIIEELFS